MMSVHVIREKRQRAVGQDAPAAVCALQEGTWGLAYYVDACSQRLPGAISA